MSFVATISEILPSEAKEIPALAETISYWNEGACQPDEWLRWTETSWGPAGFAMRRGEEVLGFVLFGPAEFLPRVTSISGELSEENTVVMACVTGDRRVKKQLLVRMLRELRCRGVESLEAVAGDLGDSRHVSTGFLLQNGWRPVRRVLHLGRSYTLMRIDLGNLVEVGELARDIIGRVKLPRLKSNLPVPGGACVQVELSTQPEFALENGSTAVLTVEMPSGVVA
ncbi:hypothetical protein BH24ACT22_BH24ACT22_03120 [soil metagenome]